MTPKQLDALATDLHLTANQLTGITSANYDRMDAVDLSRLNQIAEALRAHAITLDALPCESNERLTVSR